MADLRRKAEGVQLAALKPSATRVLAAASTMEVYLQASLKEGKDFIEAGARQFVYALSRSYMASLLLEHANWAATKDNDLQYVEAALRWCSRDLTPLLQADAAHRDVSRSLAGR
jgi:hypothetical protein